MDVNALIGRYQSGADAPRRAIEGLAGADLDAFPVPGTWSIRQIVVHLMDSDLVGSDRMKRVAAMPNPLIMNYDESAFARDLAYDRADVHAACEVFRLNRLLTAAMLRALPREAFARTGVHSEHGLITLGGLVKTYAEHLDHHLGFIRRKRAMLGTPMA